MLDCGFCLNTVPNIPLLRCGHFLCNKCYCFMKDNKIFNCELCGRKLVRGTKKNK